MTSRDDLHQKVRLTWGDSEELRLALLIFDFIAQDPYAAHIPYSRFQKIAKEQALQDPHVVERVLQYLTGADSHVLELGAELIEGDDEIRRLRPDEFALVVSDQIHPLTGERDESLPSKVFVYFSPSKLAQEVFTKHKS